MADDRMDTKPIDADARAVIARLTVDTLPRLIERLARSELGELEVRDEGWRIRLRRANGATDPSVDVRQEAKERARYAGSSTSTAQSERSASSRSASAGRRPEPDRAYVTSPAVGYFIAREGVSVGTKVNSGDVIGQVDVLGVPQEVVAVVEGTIGTFEVAPGEAIEFGQPVARVDPVGAPNQGGPEEELEASTSEQLLVEA